MTELEAVVFKGFIKVGPQQMRSVRAKDRGCEWLLFNNGFVDLKIRGRRKLIGIHHVQEMEPVDQSDPRLRSDPLAKARAAKAAKRAEEAKASH